VSIAPDSPARGHGEITLTLSRRRKLAVGGALVLGGVAAAVAFALPSSDLTSVPAANTRSAGYAPASILSPELSQIAVAQGSTKVENLSTAVSYYGYDNDTVNAAGEPVMVASTASSNHEAHKTEPDKNTYLVFPKGLPGFDANYDYGQHFLFQGHETGSPGYITRINLDADAAHRVTVLATKDDQNNNIADIDGSTWDPWAKRLLFTTENVNAPTYSATPGFPSQVHDVSGALGRGGYEGIQDDSDGNIWIVEDIGGGNKPAGCVGAACTRARIPHSYIYRYVPAKPGDLANGKLQVLQVKNSLGQPITEASQTAASTPDQLALHTYGSVFATKWVTIHDTAVDPPGPFSANAAAHAMDGTPFKRPENGVFQPGSKFQAFFFDETGDTNATSPENSCCGGWTSIFKLTQADPSAATGQLTIFYKGDQAHAGFDNVAFFTKDQISFVEDAGDTLHGQRNGLDSGFLFDVNTDYSSGAQPLRWLAEGRDASATLDADNAGFGVNEGDNEITGIHVSNGDPDVNGILGARLPNAFQAGWRVFYTQQHGDNPTYEVVRSK
jgi:hypothetical protein